jgi:hypothetical protein
MKSQRILKVFEKKKKILAVFQRFLADFEDKTASYSFGSGGNPHEGRKKEC